MSRQRLPELPPLEVAAARGCHRCLGLLLRAEEPLALQRSRRPAQEPGWSRRTLSFLTEDGSDGSDTWVALGDIPEAGPLSSTRRSLLDEPGDSGVPSLLPDCSQEPRGDTAVPLPPLASSTLLWDRDLPQEPSPSRILGTRGSPSPILGDIPFPCPHFAGRVSLRQHQGGILGTHAVSPRSLLPRGGFSSCSVAPQSSCDIPWGRAAVPYTEVTEAEDGHPAGPGDSGSLGDNSENFVTARESLGGASGGAAPVPTPRDLGLDLGQGLVSGQDLGQGLGLISGRDLGRDLVQDLGQGLGLGQGLEQDLGWEGSGAALQIPTLPSAFGALLARLGGCTLGGSPPRYPLCPGSPGGVTPRGCENLRVCHVTPRSRSRLRAVAARLRSCSSSLFPEALPISPRVPRVAVTSPPGRCVTAGDRVLPAVDGEGTGNSWGGTQIFSGFSPRRDSVLKSGPRVLRGLGDKGHPQNSLLLARGSPKPNPSVRPVPRKRRHPQKSPRVTRGVPSATSSPEPEGGTSQSQWHLLAARPPGSASRDLGTPSVSLSPSGELGTLSVPLSPSGDLETLSVPLSPGCATRGSESHQEDVMQEQAPRECHSPGGRDATSSPGSGTGQGGLVLLRDNPSPVTTWGQRRWPQGHSPELVATLTTGHVPDCAQDELALTRHFEQPECGRSWRGGQLKFSFNYLLLDPRVTRDLPQRSPSLSPAELFRTFVSAVFYVGKGTRARPWWHLHQALAQHRRGTQRGGPKVQRILEIWASGHGVVPLQCFQHRLPAEALTRESCMLEALGLSALTNARRGPCYGVAAAWPAPRRRRLGVLLLHRAMSVLLAEGERQLRPGDIPGVTPSTQG